MVQGLRVRGLWVLGFRVSGLGLWAHVCITFSTLDNESSGTVPVMDNAGFGPSAVDLGPLTLNPEPLNPKPLNSLTPTTLNPKPLKLYYPNP